MRGAAATAAVRPPRWFGRLCAATAAGAAVPLLVWAAPSTHPTPKPRVTWRDHGTTVEQRVLYRGLDRYGYVRQERVRVWHGPTANALADVRRRVCRPDAAVGLPPAQSHWAQYTSYGNDHVFAAGGVEMVECGGIHSLPYAAMAIALLMPAAAWACVAGTSRLRRTGPAR